jgi:hypothetical protein
MTQLAYRANLTSAGIPFLSELQGRTVIVPSIDQNFSRQLSSPKDKDRDIGIPQVYYCHNAVPTDAGFISVSYLSIVGPPADSDGTFSNVFELRDSADNKAYLVNTVSGRNYILLSTGSGWMRTTDMAPAAKGIVSTAYVNGVTYIYFGSIGCFKYNFGTNTLDPVVLTALNAATTLGVTASNGYMIAWNINAIAWSSLLDPTDFTPSLVTGAGGGPVQQIKAAITCCLVHQAGFVIYTKVNAVMAGYTGNTQFPFALRELVGCGGVASFDTVSFDTNTTDHIAYTTNGLESVSANGSQPIFPVVTDFIAGSQFEDFNETTQQFIVTVLGSPMQKKLTVIANRYLIFSYGINSLTHALYYDSTLARWGKLKIPHVDCFEYKVLDPSVVETPRRSIGFLQADGSLKVVALSYDTAASYGVLVLGKYQYQRLYYTTLLQVDFENVKTGANFNVSGMVSLDGTNTTNYTFTPTITSGLLRQFKARKTGQSHSLVITGGFHANSLELKFCTNGAVR